ncbi:hypothetical protein HDU91_002082, partial [Kappamyces sp. JEL0680]
MNESCDVLKIICKEHAAKSHGLGHRHCVHDLLGAVKKLQEALLRWYDQGVKSLALQQKAYRVWVSEIMLQQTRAEKVKEYYAKWIDKYPTLAQLAASSLDDVHGMSEISPVAGTQRSVVLILALWSGLGYYSRATRLREGAIYVQEK